MPRGKIEAKAEIWRDRVRRWKESGLTSTKFAAQEGIGRPQALSWWAHHLSRRDGAGKDAPRLQLVKLKPVETKRSVRDSSLITIESGRLRIAVGHGFDEATLRRVLAVVEATR